MNKAETTLTEITRVIVDGVNEHVVPVVKDVWKSAKTVFQPPVEHVQQPVKIPREVQTQETILKRSPEKKKKQVTFSPVVKVIQEKIEIVHPVQPALHKPELIVPAEYQQNIELLYDMGFTDRQKSLEYLKKHNNNIQMAVQEYLTK